MKRPVGCQAPEYPESRGAWAGVQHAASPRAVLVVTEVGLAVTLLAGATLLFASLTCLLSVDAGFDVRNRLTMELQVSGPKYRDDAVVRRFFDDALESIRAIPGVTAAGVASQLPLGGNVELYGVHLEDRPSPIRRPIRTRCGTA